MDSNLAGCFGEPGFAARRTAAGANLLRIESPRTARCKPAPAFAGGRFQASSRSLFVAVRSFTAALRVCGVRAVAGARMRFAMLTFEHELISTLQVPKTLTFERRHARRAAARAVAPPGAAALSPGRRARRVSFAPCAVFAPAIPALSNAGS
jgi:hypothetical protein